LPPTPRLVTDPLASIVTSYDFIRTWRATGCLCTSASGGGRASVRNGAAGSPERVARVASGTPAPAYPTVLRAGPTSAPQAPLVPLDGPIGVQMLAVGSGDREAADRPAAPGHEPVSARLERHP